MFVDETTHFEANGTIIFVAPCMNVLSTIEPKFRRVNISDYFVGIFTATAPMLPNDYVLFETKNSYFGLANVMFCLHNTLTLQCTKQLIIIGM